MITANFIHRTFRIRYNNSVGTAFTIDVDNRQYLITARHVIAGISNNDEIGVFSNRDWVPLSIQIVGQPDNIDISVLAPERRLTPAGKPVESSSDGLAYGQDVYFVGFPYDFLGNVIFTESGYPCPFAKKAIVSCFDKDVFLLDGHNNPGFSGSPVIFGKLGASATNIAAVISGYKFMPEPIYAGSTETPLTYKYNTGIIVTYRIEHAMSLIEANPIGLKI